MGKTKKKKTWNMFEHRQERKFECNASNNVELLTCLLKHQRVCMNECLLDLPSRRIIATWRFLLIELYNMKEHRQKNAHHQLKVYRDFCYKNHGLLFKIFISLQAFPQFLCYDIQLMSDKRSILLNLHLNFVRKDIKTCKNMKIFFRFH